MKASATHVSITACSRCGSTERYKNGNCAPCLRKKAAIRAGIWPRGVKKVKVPELLGPAELPEPLTTLRRCLGLNPNGSYCERWFPSTGPDNRICDQHGQHWRPPEGWELI